MKKRLVLALGQPREKYESREEEGKADKILPYTVPDASTLPLSEAEGSAANDHPWREEQEAAALPCQLHPSLDPGVCEELTKVNSERHDWIEQGGKPNREMMRGNYQRMADWQMSTTDPDATLMGV